ncbi:regulator putative TetR-family [Cutibacterium acnes JCM 18909]|nr:regulator putative TetR-family [Cutibacterium acnes JCM 18909]
MRGAGFTRGAFYSNFTSKDDLCTTVLRRYAEKNLATLGSSLNFPNDGHEALRDRIHDIIALFASTVGSDPLTAMAILEITIEQHGIHDCVRPTGRSETLSLLPCATWSSRLCVNTPPPPPSRSPTSSRSPKPSSIFGCWRQWRQDVRPTSTA